MAAARWGSLLLPNASVASVHLTVGKVDAEEENISASRDQSKYQGRVLRAAANASLSYDTLTGTSLYNSFSARVSFVIVVVAAVIYAQVFCLHLCL